MNFATAESRQSRVQAKEHLNFRCNFDNRVIKIIQKFITYIKIQTHEVTEKKMW